MMTSQSEESIITAAETSASQFSSTSSVLTWNNIKNLYQSYKKEWEEYCK